MKNQINDLNILNIVPSNIDLEFLEALLEPEDATYPWNLADEASEAYFHDLELQFGLQEFSDSELITSADNFYQNLDIIWDQVTVIEDKNISKNTVNYLQEALQNAFSVIPGVLLTAIAQKASEVFILEQSASEKLMECVQALLPSWETDDLLVLARPFAYAMRSSKPHTLTSIIRDVEHRDWANLSEIEQAKITLAIADYALQHLSKYDSQPNS
ncbi:hypothetical protein MEN41_04440 [Dolichospermum sp. ST_con]|nr:hypothetical protein [Dolichospermum sp. ST_con]MDD1418997.1 hypothetical protein [Dolichospermum sp. ST_sed1]MDD1425105.1 hypothetical protein [Dolichospermum sp. ST_sed9]MDD1431191.1 hypothetical protein [Dolichospermum sp. ST_sed6]MDD1441718.1 hypothetical protein [Dolichospermum sp. ST_sed3]MDD1444630.1 hypothetical protein [Dolichospermum sp. ST_sed8]MDD1455472.1 hypothetical protein [Dolichospermum sp. ST_sed7]MDD1460338.1 hypothetical protein [Dolichospermum sp. ST_sed2]MDD1465278